MLVDLIEFATASAVLVLPPATSCEVQVQADACHSVVESLACSKACPVLCCSSLIWDRGFKAPWTMCCTPPTLWCQQPLWSCLTRLISRAVAAPEPDYPMRPGHLTTLHSWQSSNTSSIEHCCCFSTRRAHLLKHTFYILHTYIYNTGYISLM